MIINTKSFHNLFTLALCIVVAILLLKMCYAHKPQLAVTPIPTVNEQKQIIKTDSIASKHYTDSIKDIIRTLNEDAKKADIEYSDLAEKYNSLTNNMDSLLVAKVPDTCRSIVDALNAQFKKVSAASRARDIACTGALEGQKALVRQKDVLISRQTIDFNKLKANLDSSLQYQTILTKQVKQLKPKHSIGTGIFGEANYITPYTFAAGIQLYYRDRKGTQLTIGVLSNQRVQIGLSKNLFRF